MIDVQLKQITRPLNILSSIVGGVVMVFLGLLLYGVGKFLMLVGGLK